MDQVLASMDGIEGDFDTRRPDFTFVNLHQIDSAGHASGPGGLYDSAIGLADAEIERLVTALRQRGEWERTVLILVSDHSMDATPNKIVLTQALTDAGIAERSSSPSTTAASTSSTSPTANRPRASSC